MTGNVLFNDVLNTFYIQLYGVGHMVKDHSDRENMLLPLLLDGEGGGVGGSELLTCPYPLKVQARPPRDQTPALTLGYQGRRAFLLAASVLLIHSTDKITHTMAFVTPVVKHWLAYEIAQWVHIFSNNTLFGH